MKQPALDSNPIQSNRIKITSPRPHPISFLYCWWILAFIGRLHWKNRHCQIYFIVASFSNFIVCNQCDPIRRATGWLAGRQAGRQQCIAYILLLLLLLQIRYTITQVSRLTSALTTQAHLQSHSHIHTNGDKSQTKSTFYSTLRFPHATNIRFEK